MAFIILGKKGRPRKHPNRAKYMAEYMREYRKQKKEQIRQLARIVKELDPDAYNRVLGKKGKRPKK